MKQTADFVTFEISYNFSMHIHSEVKPLTTLAIPLLFPQQLSKFSRKSMHSEVIMQFNAENALRQLVAKEGARVIGADFGGDKGISQLFIVRGGRLVVVETYSDYVQSTYGDGYMDSLEKTAAYAAEHHIPVGLSWGAPLEGTKPQYHPKAMNFLKALDAKYGGDFASVIPTMAACINDGPAGLISAAIEVNRTTTATNVLFPMNGGGLNIAVLKDGEIFSNEAGHVEAVKELNIYNQTKACEVYGAEYVCIERLGANKAGIEAQWELLKGSYMRAVDIEVEYKAGNVLARDLYDHSALMVAHMLAGTARAYDIDLSDPQTAIVGHGGAFKFPDYTERIHQILGGNGQTLPRFIATHEYTSGQSNACLDGAALAAILAS